MDLEGLKKEVRRVYENEYAGARIREDELFALDFSLYHLAAKGLLNVKKENGDD